jgi:hypothetical protein
LKLPPRVDIRFGYTTRNQPMLVGFNIPRVSDIP